MLLPFSYPPFPKTIGMKFRPGIDKGSIMIDRFSWIGVNSKKRTPRSKALNARTDNAIASESRNSLLLVLTILTCSSSEYVFHKNSKGDSGRRISTARQNSESYAKCNP